VRIAAPWGRTPIGRVESQFFLPARRTVTGMDNGPHAMDNGLRATYGMMYKKYVKKEDNITNAGGERTLFLKFATSAGKTE
jgi:hypothetical protein